MIKVNQLNKYFNRHKKNEIHVLNDITLDFPKKGLVVLLGASGSGKTTLLNVIGGLDKVQGGQIAFETNMLNRYSAGTWDKIRCEAVGYIFQNYNLLPELSVYDNIAFVLKMIGINDPALIEARVHYILHAVKMFSFRKKKALQLSGGQMQRVAIARALVKNPKVVIADEPTGNLDSKNTLEIMNIIKEISKERLVILVTHEKELAKFYGDRIIEISDGKVIDDQANASDEAHGMSHDDTIYLQDLTKLSDATGPQLDVKLYSDMSEKDVPVKVRLVIKNKTLYLDVDTDLKKVKLADESSGVIIKDEAFVAKTREEQMATSFDPEVLNNDKIKRDRRAMVSFKQTLQMAFIKVMRTSRKGKLMLFSFLAAGAVIAFTIATLASVVIVRPEPYMAISRGYVHVTRSGLQTLPDYDSLMAYRQPGDDDFYIHGFSQGSVNFLLPDGSDSTLTIYGQIDLTRHVADKRLTAGRHPLTHNEILISRGLADQLINNSPGQENGIWTYEHMFQERSRYLFVDIRIVGIVDSDINLIYMTPELATLAQPVILGESYMLSDYFVSSTDVIHGALPEAGQMVISKAYYEAFPALFDGNWPVTIPDSDLAISGVHDFPDGDDVIFMPTADIEKIRYSQRPFVHVYTADPAGLVSRLETAGLNATDVYQSAYENARSQQQVVLYSTIGTSAFLIGFAALGFYFVIRSSLISRIYEVSVYRALGVRKTDIFRSFLVEIFVITTISTLVGYILATMALNRLQEGVLGNFNFFLVTPLSIGAGILVAYAINMLAGILPVYLLLQKTPAQILSQYDI